MLNFHSGLDQSSLDNPTSFAPSLDSCAIADIWTRDHPASEVYVTGTFDDWAKSVKLEKKGDGFEKLVDLPPSEDRILYKVRMISSIILARAVC